MAPLYEATEPFDQFESEKSDGTCDLLSPVNHQSIPVGVAKGRPMTNFRFSRSEEEGNAMVAQVPNSSFKMLDFKCN